MTPFTVTGYQPVRADRRINSKAWTLHTALKLEFAAADGGEAIDFAKEVVGNGIASCLIFTAVRGRLEERRAA